MSDFIQISDSEDETTPPPSKRARKNPTATVLNLDTDPSPQKQPPGSASTPLVLVDEAPLFDDVTVVKSSSFVSGIGVSSHRESHTFSGKRVISLESDSEDNSEPGTAKKLYEPVHGADDSWKQRCGLESGSSDADSDDDTSWMQSAGFRSTMSKDAIEVDSDHEKEDTSDEKMGRQKQAESYKSTYLSVDALPKKKMSKDEKISAAEEKKLRNEQEKLQKAAMKAEDAEHKKLEKEKKKWEKDKALKSIVALIDNKLIEESFGVPSVDTGRLVSGLQEKGITYRVTSNPIERSIVWEITLPEDIAQSLPLGSKIPYVLLVYEAEDFCNLVANKELLENVSRVRDEYPSYTICYLTNKLMSYVNKKERIDYNDRANRSGWSKPPIDEAIAKLTTHYIGIHSRHCVDEAEVAEHVVRLTSNLAYYQVRDKLTRWSVCADSTLMSQKGADKHLIRESLWLKVLVAIPKVPPRHALAVSKRYPYLKSLLEVYMNPNMSVHDKEFILKDLKVENLVGEDRKVGEACSKRIYRVLMSKDGTLKTDDVVDGAASFTLPPYDLD
ncbi:PREDICTED: crossover junction endonuclease EME1A-like isoform X1 [Camelina sativa]|uniref:Crossover junction endonuclease EME1A-like isoform X1 n=1 Tax=Camelina sativa TaxID=90675 RepID=A0ABM0WK00_CAMSA|nr:PREDICTED: crossover junction endonuclease EME1A-like isoform X1 [Camelina sativa]